MLKVRGDDSVFLYVNSSFAPALDEVVGNLYLVRTNKYDSLLWMGKANSEQCFKDSKDQLIVTYSMTPAFG